MMKHEVIKIEHLNVLYDNHYALKDISFTVYENDYLGIIGPNGGGKTTLIKSILGLIKPHSGTIKVFGKPIQYKERLIAYVPQVGNADRTFPMTVIDNVLLGLLPKKITPFHHFSSEDLIKANKALEQVGIAHLKNRHISEMSGGEYQKSMIARAIVRNPKILLLDEPTANVDHNSRADIYELLHQLNKNMTILIVTHDTLAVSAYIKNLACLDQNLVYHGLPGDVGESIEKMYNCPIELIAHGHTPHRVVKSHEEDQHHD
jgi:zinc transport system ATP-binding protein